MVRDHEVHDANIVAGAPPTPAAGLWRAEIDATVKLALPIALTQLGQVAMMTSDLVLIGHLGDGALAAAALAQTVLFAAFVLGMGSSRRSRRSPRRPSARASRAWCGVPCASACGRR